jgi:hypothetical protein
MSAPDRHDRDGPRPELLAAYADGELDPAARDRVERWLAAHPEAREQLWAQRALSPANRPLWRRAEPPAPYEDDWAEVNAAIRRGVSEPVRPVRSDAAWRRLGWWVASGIGSVAAAAAVVWLAAQPAAPPSHGAPPIAQQPSEVADEDPLAGYAVLPVVSADELELHRVPGNAGPVAFGGDLLTGSMVLLGAEDVKLEDVDPDDWPDGEPQMTTGPGDAPMLFGAKPR